jgi:hypothetical protein
MSVPPDESNPAGFSFLVGKAALEPDFARALGEDPAAALRSIGIEPTDEILAALDGIDTDAIKDLAEALDGQRGIV